MALLPVKFMNATGAILNKHGEQWQLLFKHKEGRVHAEVWGFRIGWKKRAINLFRWKPSTKVPGGFDKVAWFELADLPYLEKCLKRLREWETS